MDIKEILQKIGLSEKEANIYLAVLELGAATGYAVARRTGTKRPTTYLILEALEYKRLIHKVPRPGKILFTAESPEILLRDLNKKAELAKRGLPYLLALFNAKKESPQVELFQGRESIKEAFEKITQASTLRLFGTSVESLKIYPEGLSEGIKLFHSRKIKVKDILTDPVAEAYYLKLFKDQPDYQIRFTKPGTRIQSDFALFNNTVMLFSYQPEIFVVMITSKDLAHMFEVFFELAWESALPANYPV